MQFCVLAVGPFFFYYYIRAIKVNRPKLNEINSIRGILNLSKSRYRRQRKNRREKTFNGPLKCVAGRPTLIGVKKNKEDRSGKAQRRGIDGFIHTRSLE